MVSIIFKNKDVVIISKKAGVPSQSDLTQDTDALAYTKQLLLDMSEKDELWLVHRLDRVVGGLLAFARNKETAKKLSELFMTQNVEKEYLAIVEGDVSSGILQDYLYKDAKLGKAFVVDTLRKGAKSAELEYKSLAKSQTERGVYTLVSVKLKTGRFHQIRVQFASRGMPLVGDGKYGSHDNRAKMPALYANRVAFSINNKKTDIKEYPNTQEYPWSLFESVLGEKND